MIRPSRIIGPGDDPYLLRWHLLRIWKLPRIYIHKFMRSDDDRAMHDHPWSFISVLLRGSYIELRPNGPHIRRAPSIAFRSIKDRHRIVLFPDINPWTLFITGPVVRRWGFWCPRPGGDQFIPSREFDGCD